MVFRSQGERYLLGAHQPPSKVSHSNSGEFDANASRSQPETPAPAYQRLAEPQAQAENRTIHHEASPAIADHRLPFKRVGASILFSHIEQSPNLPGLQRREQGALATVGPGVPA